MNTKDLSRRNFVKTTGAVGAGLVIGFNIPWLQGCDGPPAMPVEGGMQPNAWIRIDPAGFVHVVYDDHEMGQGSSTGFLMMVCDELDADWSKIIWEPVPTDPRTRPPEVTRCCLRRWTGSPRGKASHSSLGR